MNESGNKVRIAATTNDGLLRKNNEDAYLIGTDLTTNDFRRVRITILLKNKNFAECKTCSGIHLPLEL